MSKYSLKHQIQDLRGYDNIKMELIVEDYGCTEWARTVNIRFNISVFPNICLQKKRSFL